MSTKDNDGDRALLPFDDGNIEDGSGRLIRRQ
jgi:hypothetical protein